MFGTLWGWVRGGLAARNRVNAAAQKFPRDAAALRTARDLAIVRARRFTAPIGTLWRKLAHPPLKLAAPLARKAARARLAFHDRMQKKQRVAAFNRRAGGRTNVMPHAQALKKPTVPAPVPKPLPKPVPKPVARQVPPPVARPPVAPPAPRPAPPPVKRDFARAVAQPPPPAPRPPAPRPPITRPPMKGK